MKHAILIYGPAGCGKTTNKEVLRNAYGADSVYDDAENLYPSWCSQRAPWPVTGCLYLSDRLPPCPVPDLLIVAYEDAVEKAAAWLLERHE